MPSNNKQARFVIVALIHCDGELRWIDDNLDIFITPAHLHPVLTVISDDKEPEFSLEDKHKIKIAALHALVKRAEAQLSDMNKAIDYATPIPMKSEGGVN